MSCGSGALPDGGLGDTGHCFAALARPYSRFFSVKPGGFAPWTPVLLGAAACEAPWTPECFWPWLGRRRALDPPVLFGAAACGAPWTSERFLPWLGSR